MMNNNTQVSPGNRVDFSRIRKALFGTKIPKFQNPYLPLDLTVDEYNTRRNKYAAKDEFFTNGLYDFAKMYEYYKAHPEQFKDLSGITATPVWEGAERNTRGFGDWNSQFDQTGLNYFFGYNADKADYFGPTTSARKAFLDYIKSREQATVVPTVGNQTVNTQVTPEDTNIPAATNTTLVEPYNVVEYPAQELQSGRKFRFPTFPLYNAALLGVANLTNKRILDTQLKAPSMRYQAPTLYSKVTNNYGERQANNQALQEYQWKVQLQLNNTADLGRSQEALRDLMAQELAVKMLNNKSEQDGFNLTTLNFQNTANTNLQNWNQSANLNRQAWVSEARDRLNAIAQYQAQRGQNLQENIMSNYTDWKAWNRNNALQDYADWRANEYLKVIEAQNKALDTYLSASDLEKYQGYKDFWTNKFDASGNPIDTTDAFTRAYDKYLHDHPELVDNAATRKKFFLDNIDSEDLVGSYGTFTEDWKLYQKDALSNYIKALRNIQTKWGFVDARNKPINFDGENSSWLYWKMNPRPSFQYMAKGGRFLEYLRHNRRAEKEIRDTTMKSMSESRLMLKRDLDALDRESLLLLRAIFK